MLGDAELTVAAATELLKKCPEFDILLTAEAKGIPLAHEMSRQSGKPYVCARKGVKLYMPDPFVAVTGADENNLVACQIAKREFGVNRTVARASNPKNRELLHTLGVDTVVCGTDNLSHILEREIETDTIRQLLSLGGGTASLNEILLPENFKFAGQAVKDIPMPGDVILVCITRDAEFIIPHGNTTLLPWDRILCLTQDDTLHLLMDAWGLSGK